MHAARWKEERELMRNAVWRSLYSAGTLMAALAVLVTLAAFVVFSM
jgi:hypothetical protein